MKAALTFLSLMLVAVFGPSARGEVLTFAMEGSVSYLNDSLHMLDWVHLGDPMTYTFSFDSQAPDTNPSPSAARYSGLSASLRVGGHTVPVLAPSIEIAHPMDAFRLHSSVQFDAGFPGDIYLTLADQSENNALTSVTLPLVAYDLTPFDLKYFDAGMHVPDAGGTPTVTLDFGGNIDSFYSVPEPQALVLLFAGLLLLGRGHL